MSIFRWGVLGLVLALSAFARPSAAQDVTLNSIGITHSENGHGNRLVSALNRRDCLVDDQLRFPVTVDHDAGLALEVWAGIGCDELVARINRESTQCWRLASLTPTSSSPALEIPVRDLLSGYTLAGPGQSSGDPNVACQPALESPSAQSLWVYFMLVDGSGAIQGSFATWGATYKLTAPAPPDHVSLGIGNQKLLAAFSYGQASGDATIDGYQLYCEPAGAADSDAGSTACAPSARLVAGASTDAIPDLRCGTAGRADTVGPIAGLTNNLSYNVAVAATDTYENIGVLSPVACAAPLANVSDSDNEQTSKACGFALGRPSFPLLPSIALGVCLLRRRRPRRRGLVRCGSGGSCGACGRKGICCIARR